MYIDSAPHDWLFPRVSAVVHHGGAGTTAIGLRSGKPTVIIPFFGDQPFWGKKVYSIGRGAKPIPAKKLTVKRLSKALKQATSDKEMIRAAKKIGAKIQREEGAKKAVDFIDKYLP